MKQGEGILGDAEKRIEQLVSEDGRTTPLKVSEVQEAPAASPAKPPSPPKVHKPVAPPADDDDVPF